MMCVLISYCNHDTYFIVFSYIENFFGHLYIKSTHFMHNKSLVKCFKKHIFICGSKIMKMKPIRDSVISISSFCYRTNENWSSFGIIVYLLKTDCAFFSFSGLSFVKTM